MPPKAQHRDPTRDAGWSADPFRDGERIAISLAPDEAPWRPDSDQSVGPRMTEVDGHTVVAPRDGAHTIRVAYLFSGKARRASIAEELRRLCEKSGMGLSFEQIDIYVGGASHNLLDKERQADLEARIADGEFDFIILSPPCGSWSRCNYSSKPGARPCRSKEFPWGFLNSGPHQKARAEQGNEFIHFCIRAVEATLTARKRHGHTCRVLWEHPEDLGTTPKGTPASIWQLSEIRRFVCDEHGFYTVVGHQCPFGVDYAKPTRLLSDIPGVKSFGVEGWPTFRHNGSYAGPLAHCGHDHRTPTHGSNDSGGFNSSSKAAYPPKMCVFFAVAIHEDAMDRFTGPKGGERARQNPLLPLRPESNPLRRTGSRNDNRRNGGRGRRRLSKLRFRTGRSWRGLTTYFSSTERRLATRPRMRRGSCQARDASRTAAVGGAEGNHYRLPRKGARPRSRTEGDFAVPGGGRFSVGGCRSPRW